jgi:hypothetical protein
MNIFINASNKDRADAFKICRSGDADRSLIAQFERRMSDIHKTKQKLEKFDIDQLSNLIQHCQDDKMMDVILSNDTVINKFVTANHEERTTALRTCNMNNKFRDFEHRITDIVDTEIKAEVENVLTDLLENVEPVNQKNEVNDVLTGIVDEMEIRVEVENALTNLLENVEPVYRQDVRNEIVDKVETSYNKDKFNDAMEELTDLVITKDLVAEILSFENSKDDLIVDKSSNLAFIQNLIKETLQEKEESENLAEICERLEELFLGMNQENKSVESDLSPNAKPYVPTGQSVQQNGLTKT